ncbi:MAG: YkuS family protein [Bacillota bacterium]|nr:YkuS family protein [Bacillota bacterium]
MKGIIAVSEALSDYREMLEEEGYQVVSLEEGLDVADAVLISGMDVDHSGISAIDTEAPVLDVTGKRPDEVLRALERRLELL